MTTAFLTISKLGGYKMKGIKRLIKLKTPLNTVTIESLEKDGFTVLQEDNMNGIKGLALISQNNIIKTANNSISLRNSPKEIILYNNTEEVLQRLNKVKAISDVVVRVYINTSNVPIIDMQNYTGMKTLYDEALAKKVTIESDKDLYRYITKQRIPQVKLIKTRRKIGKALFVGSSIREFESEAIVCTDMNLILKIEAI